MTTIERGTDQHVRGQVSRMFDRLVDSNSTATTVDWSKARSQYRTFSSNAILAFSDPPNSGIFTLAVFNSSGGSITITLPATSTLASTTVLTSDVNYLFYWYDGEAASVERYILISEENANVVPLVLSVSLPDGDVGVAYSGTLSATGGVTPYTYSVSSGALPDGLTLNASTGAVTGTPTVEDVFGLTVMVTDNNGGTDDSAESITITSETFVNALMAKMLFWDDCDTGAGECDATGNEHLVDTGSLSYVAGLIDTGVDISSTYGIVNTTSLFSGIGTSGFTIGIAVKDPSGSGEMLIGQWLSSGNYKFALRRVSGNYVLSVSDDGTTITSVTAGAVPGDSNWHFIMGWYDPATDTIYASLDNGTPNTASFTATLHTTTSAFSIGAASGTVQADVDFAFVADEPLSTAERNWLYNSAAGRDWIYPSKLTPTDNFGHTLSGGGLTATRSSTAWLLCRAVGSGRTTGKYYFEMTVGTVGAGGGAIGAVTSSASVALNSFVGFDANGWGWINSGNKYHNNTGASHGSTWTNGDVVGCALDIDNGKIWFSKNGTWQASGDPGAGTNEAYAGLTGRLMPAIGFYFSGNNGTVAFSDVDLTYAPPSGFLAWEQVP